MKNVSWRFQNSSMNDTFGKHAFAVYGPLAWNCLPKEIRLCDEIEAFKRNLKTHLFVKFVNESTLAIWFWRIIVKCPRMLSAQFVALYKPCKPKPKPTFWAQQGSDTKLSSSHRVGAQQKCCTPLHLDCWMPATNLPTCYAMAETEIFLSLMTFLSYLLVFQNVYPEQFNPPTS